MLAPRRLALAAALFVACGEHSSVTGEGQPTTGTSTTSTSGQVEPTTGDETSTGSSSTSGPSTTTTSTSGTTTTGTTAVDDTATTGGDSCVDVADCEQSGGDCTKVQCLELECVRVDLEPGSECGLGVCDGEGSCVECNVQADCDPGELCEDHVCHAPDCFDGGKNGLETDIDCGGASCEACEAGQSCEIGDDCQSSVCADEVCLAPTCSDGVRNGDESDVDCGGPLCPKCEDGKHCNEGDDCLAGSCENSKCAPN